MKPTCFHHIKLIFYPWVTKENEIKRNTNWILNHAWILQMKRYFSLSSHCFILFFSDTQRVLKFYFHTFHANTKYFFLWKVHIIFTTSCFFLRSEIPNQIIEFVFEWERGFILTVLNAFFYTLMSSKWKWSDIPFARYLIKMTDKCQVKGCKTIYWQILGFISHATQKILN